jgi:hypothetical protein
MRLTLRIIAIILALSLMIGESIRSYGQDRHLIFVIDDFLLGAFLIAGAIAFASDTLSRRATFAAAWATTAGMLYGSFFGKVFPPAVGANFQTNIDAGMLTMLIGIAFATSIIGMFATIALPSKPT